MTKRKGIRKRYLITVASILLGVLSVLILRGFDMNFSYRKTMIIKELTAIMEFNKHYFKNNIQNKSTNEKTKFLRDNFANKISYQKLFDEKEDFKNFKYLPDKKIYGFKLLNNAHIGFYHNSDNCGTSTENKDYCAGIIIDTNGYTRPNQFGKDQFLFKLYKDKITE